METKFKVGDKVKVYSNQQSGLREDTEYTITSASYNNERSIGQYRLKDPSGSTGYTAYDSWIYKVTLPEAVESAIEQQEALEGRDIADEDEPPTEEAPLFTLHQSQSERIWACPYKTYLADILGLKGRTKPDYFTLGEMYHFALGVYRHPKNSHLDESVRHSGALLATQDKYALASEEVKKDFVFLVDRVCAFDREAPMTALELVEPHLSARVSEGFNIHIGGTPDGILKQHGKYYLVEYKTARSANASYFRSLKHGPQPIWYMLLLRNMLMDLGEENPPIGGVIYEVCEKTKSGKVVRETVVLDQKAYERGEKYVHDTIIHFALMHAKAKWPRNLQACYGKFNTECNYMHWCYRNAPVDEMHNDLLGTLYEIVDPKEQLEERQNPQSDYVLEV